MGLRSRLLLIHTLCLITAFAMGCKSKTSPYASFNDDPSNGSGNTTPPSLPAVSTVAPLALHVYSKYDHQDFITNHIFAETGTADCVATAATPVVTCTMSVPEGRT